MLKVENVSFGFPDKDLYEKISFSLEEGTHAAFIGTNGTGKSTLIQMILHGDDYLYDGKIILSPEHRIGYVSQFSAVEPEDERTVMHYMSEPFIAQQETINRICAEMESGENIEELMEAYQEAWDLFCAMDGDNYEVNIKKELKIAGLEALVDMPIRNISSGEFKLVQIIREMITFPGLLIMDEPDTFLDFENVNALRDLINQHKGTLLVITHNRYLLNYCFDKILHLENQELQEFDGTYQEYQYMLLETKVTEQELHAEEMEEIKRNEKIVEKMRALATYMDNASHGRALHARVTYLKRLEERQTPSPFVHIPQPDIALHTEEPLEGVVLTAKDYALSYDEMLLEGVNFEIQAGEKVAIVGANGTGKSSLLREIVANNNAGLALAEGVQVGFLSQTPGETLEITKETEKMSGGEKTLFQLERLGKGTHNLLLLDEPTSHLDTYAQEVLENAMCDYEGTILLVSHDYYTIANVVDYVLLIEDKTIRKVSARKFRKMMYAEHFDVKQVEIEQKRREVKRNIERALLREDTKSARANLEKLDDILQDKKLP